MNKRTAADIQNGKCADSPLRGDGKHVLLVLLVRDDLLSVAQGGKRPDGVTRARRLLVLLALSEGEHPLLHLPRDVADVTRQDLCGVSEYGAVCRGIDLTRAGRNTSAHLSVDAGTLPSDVTRENAAAGRNTEDLTDGFRRAPGIARRAVGTEIRPAVRGARARDEQARIFFLRDLDIGIGFCILQLDIVARRMTLDQHVFKRQRLDLTVAKNIVEIKNERNHPRRFCAMRAADKITAHAVLQFFGFADVKDPAILILH